MLRKKPQQRYLEKNHDEWQQQLRAFAGSADPEALHQLRVAVKKIRALAHFTNACAGGKANRKFKGLKKMFRQAGIIRDAGKTRQFETQLAETQRFIGHIREYRRQGKRAGKRLLSTISKIPAECIRDWYAVQLVSTGILLSSSGDELHKARKQIKELLYMEKLLPEAIQVELRLDRDYLDKLQEAIGNWHDALIANAAARAEKEVEVRVLAANFYLRINASR